MYEGKRSIKNIKNNKTYVDTLRQKWKIKSHTFT